MLGIDELSRLFRASPLYVEEKASEYRVEFAEISVRCDLCQLRDDISAIPFPDTAFAKFYFDYDVDCETEIFDRQIDEVVENLANEIATCVEESSTYRVEIVVNKGVSRKGSYRIYSYEAFKTWYLTWSLESRIETLNNALHKFGSPVVRCSFPNDEGVELSFGVSLSDGSPLSSDERMRIVNKRRSLVNIESFQDLALIPQDLGISKHRSIEDVVIEKLKKECSMLSLAYLCNRAKMSGDVLWFEMQGLRGIAGEYASDASEASDQCVLELVKWIYTGGEVFDKIEIARNSLSVQNDLREVLPVAPETIAAIERAYQIYLIRDVKVYLEAREKLISLINEYCDRIAECSMAYVSDFKTNLLALLGGLGAMLFMRQIENPAADYFQGELALISASAIFVSLVLGIVLFVLCRRRAAYYRRAFHLSKKSFSDIFTIEEADRLFDDPPRYRESDAFMRRWSLCLLITWILICVFLLVVIGIASNPQFVCSLADS